MQKNVNMWNRNHEYRDRPQTALKLKAHRSSHLCSKSADLRYACNGELDGAGLDGVAESKHDVPKATGNRL